MRHFPLYWPPYVHVAASTGVNCRDASLSPCWPSYVYYVAASTGAPRRPGVIRHFPLYWPPYVYVAASTGDNCCDASL